MTKLPTPQYGANTEETIKNLFGVVMKFRKELEYALYHLGDDNIISLDASKIKNLEVGNLVTQTTVTQTLVADKGYIAELTVDQLDTSDKVQNYLAGDTSDVNYIKIYDQYVEFITGVTDGLSEEQAVNRFGDPVYWIDDTKQGITYEDTGIPVMIYTYEEEIKMTMKFLMDTISGYYVPVLQMGLGDGATEVSGKSFIYKDNEGLKIQYFKQGSGDLIEIGLTDEGLYFYPYANGITLEQLDIYDDGFKVKWKGTDTKTYLTEFDSSGYISLITEVDTGQEIPVTVHSGNLP